MFMIMITSTPPAFRHRAADRHAYRFPYGEDPDINEILRLDLADRTTTRIASFVKRGMDVHDLLQYPEFYSDPHHQVEPDVVALLKAALPFTTRQGLNATAVDNIPECPGRLAVWASIVTAIHHKVWGRVVYAVHYQAEDVAEITICLNLLADAGARLDECTDEDENFIDSVIDSEKMVEAIRRIGAVQHVADERAVLKEAVDGIETHDPAKRRRL
ncbi:TPA: hypothetical protein QDB45_001649 [Burkholderia vietnamiensis]|nr:hypothetical protein [Burkholderia vietnamiensis]